MIDLNQQLSENFKLFQFVTSQTAERKEIDNTPTKEVVLNLKKLCDTILEPAWFACGPLSVSSGYRCEALNAAIGGAKTSGHILGFCADIIPLKATKLEFARWVIKNVPFDQVILEFGTNVNPSWIHVSSDPRERKQVLQILSGTGYVSVVI